MYVQLTMMRYGHEMGMRRVAMTPLWTAEKEKQKQKQKQKQKEKPGAS